jgi:hypothetical protein
MKLEQQVCSRDLAKRLKELGVKQEGHFWWLDHKDEEPSLSQEGHFHGWNNDNKCRAFTVAELGEVLWLKASPDQILEAYGQVFNVPETPTITPEGLAQCMENASIVAKMLIYLLENNLIDRATLR